MQTRAPSDRIIAGDNGRDAGMRLTFLGSGDAFGTGGRFNTCFHVAASDGDFLIDCGATSMVAMRRFGVDPNSIATIFLTHLHGDHFGGLPFFILDAQLISRRRAPLTITGPVGLKQRLHDVMKTLFPGAEKIEQKFDAAADGARAGNGRTASARSRSRRSSPPTTPARRHSRCGWAATAGRSSIPATPRGATTSCAPPTAPT